jgi:hypothetical protein
MTLHRLAVPSATYFLRGNPGPLLPGYDFINGNPGPITPADTAASTQPGYVGTWLVAFGEDATALNTNRGMRALADGQDLLDNYVNESFPRVTTLEVILGAPSATLALTGSIFVGQSGTTSTPENRNLLVHILSSTFNEIEIAGAYPAGTRVVPTLIHDGIGNTVVGTTASGFYTNPSVDLSVALPPGTYKVVVGVQSSIADQALNNKGGLVGNIIKGDTGVHADVQRMLRTLHSTVTAPWDANWATTVAALAASGLDGRYRHSTLEPVSLQLDTPGAGAVIIRDGIAPESKNTSATGYLDPINANWKATMGGNRGTGAVPSNTIAAATGFVAYGSRRSVKGANSHDDGAILGASSFLSLWPHDFSSATPITNSKTYVRTGIAAIGNPTVGAGFTGADVVELGASGGYFHNGSKSSVAIGYDLLEVLDNTGAAVATYVIVAIDDGLPTGRRAMLKTLGGAPASFSVNQALFSVRWVTTLFQQGGGSGFFTGLTAGTPPYVALDNFMVAAPPLLTTNPANEIPGIPSSFYGDNLLDRESRALQWGGHSDDFAAASYSAKGYLGSAGGVYATGYVTIPQATVNVSGAKTIDMEIGSRWGLNLTGNTTLTIINLKEGDTLDLFIRQDAGGPYTLTWAGTNTSFSGTDAIPSQTVGNINLYVGKAMTVTGGLRKLYFTKTVYP